MFHLWMDVSSRPGKVVASTLGTSPRLRGQTVITTTAIPSSALPFRGHSDVVVYLTGLDNYITLWDALQDFVSLQSHTHPHVWPRGWPAWTTGRTRVTQEASQSLLDIFLRFRPYERYRSRATCTSTATNDDTTAALQALFPKRERVDRPSVREVIMLMENQYDAQSGTHTVLACQTRRLYYVMLLVSRYSYTKRCFENSQRPDNLTHICQHIFS